MNDIFYEIINEAMNGSVIIDNESWPISFNTIINDKEYKSNNNETLIINNEEKFFKLLKEYIDLEIKLNRKIPKFYSDIEKNKLKWIISYIFVNATSEEFKNPEELLRRKIEFLKDNKLNSLNNPLEININELINNSKIIIKKEQSPISMETPNKITLSITDGNNIYNLPNIYYGIDSNTCYIYSIQMPKDNKDSLENIKYNKKINRFLYKVNDKVKDTEEYYQYKNNESDYYPEGNITDVTVSFVFALNIFLSILRTINIEKIKVVPYLPLRYKSREIVSEKSSNKEEYETRNNNIQNNLTNKFIRTFLRLVEQNPNLEILSYPYDTDEFLTLKLKEKNKEIDNMLLEEIDNSISDNKRSIL